ADRMPDELAKQVTARVQSYDLAIKPTCGAGPAGEARMPYPQALRKAPQVAPNSQPVAPNSQPNRQVASKDLDLVAPLQLLRALDRGDYNEVARCLDLDDLDTRRELSLRRLIAQLAEIQTTSRYSTLQVALRPLDEVMLPQKQIVVSKD